MDINIYVVYDSEIETEESVNRFISVMEKAQYPIDKIIPMSNIQFNEYIDNKQILPFVICLNSTFKTYCIKYSDILNVPVLEFFSKDYYNSEKNVYLAGILLNIESIFQASYKKYAWTVLKSFLKVYLSTLENLKDNSVAEDATKALVEIQEEKADQIVEEILVKESKKAADELVIQTTQNNEIDSVKEINFDPENLKDFYFQVKTLINQFNIVQEQIKLFDQYIHNEKL